MTRSACARLDSNEIPTHTSFPKAFSAPEAAEHMPLKSTLACVLQWHLCTQHKQNCRLRMASRFLSSSSLASIIVFSSWNLCCGVAEFKLQSDSLYYLFSAMIYFSTSRVSEKYALVPALVIRLQFQCIHFLVWSPHQRNAFAWETKVPSISELPFSKIPQNAGVFELRLSRNIDFITQKSC